MFSWSDAVVVYETKIVLPLFINLFPIPRLQQLEQNLPKLQTCSTPESASRPFHSSAYNKVSVSSDFTRSQPVSSSFIPSPTCTDVQTISLPVSSHRNETYHIPKKSGPVKRLTVSDYNKRQHSQADNAATTVSPGMITCSMSRDSYEKERAKLDKSISEIRKSMSKLVKQGRSDPRFLARHQKYETDLLLLEMDREMTVFEYHTGGLCMLYGDMGKKLPDEYLLQSEKLTMCSEEGVKLMLTKKIPQKARERLLKVGCCHSYFK